MPSLPAVDVRRAAERCVTRLDGIESRHSFSFGRHYDGTNTSYGVLLANNDDVLQAGAGFGTHPHRDVEIVTWVLQGSLVHRDSTGRSGVLHPGLVQRMSAGSGVLHSETNDSWRLSGGAPHEEPAHVVQMWVAPDETGLAPSYEQRDVEAELRGGGLVTLASGMAGHDAAVPIASRQAALHVARLCPGRAVALPDAPYVHLFVARGEVDLEGIDIPAGGAPVCVLSGGDGRLAAGDSARLTATGGRRVTADSPSEVLVWEMRAVLPR